MFKIAFLISVAVVVFTSCKKGTVAEKNNQLYPLAAGNKWIYIDSFFDASGTYLGKDTFPLKAAKTIVFNTRVYTPLTDIYDDSIFIVSSTDAEVFILNELGETLMFRWPLDVLPVITNSYHKDSLISMIYTERQTLTVYPSYRVLITRDDGKNLHYKQQELFFSPGIGIISGRDIRKDLAGNFYIYDSYKLISYSLN